MIFVTVGTQEPFDRLIKAIDEVYSEMEDKDLIVQAPLENFEPKNFKTVQFINPSEFSDIFERADLIIGHAGTGTILSALVKQKPLIIMPRICKYGEHRNDHQLSTVQKFGSFENIHVAEDEEALKKLLIDVSPNDINASKKLSEGASEELISSIRDYINRK
ncbi:hypothetical protein LZ575_03385 [Antarcticibacterium sp. 1MA-6-2]|uniref:glycosyltransferase n=1 Tax=Antarcticibacterium sp. 1MA-6-2 TaxID=2908210 RepID=UPI001F3143F9|nr:glycosyltransferase [Antarcticibacterium sp. 1MA-6-2]UJH91739.1 hypothetical protein LZ575_03385 [Antarcticibacterium sp. 1MA-6-2]